MTEVFSFPEDGGLRATFIERVPGVDGSTDREETLSELGPYHRKVIEKLGFSWDDLWRAEQVHGNKVAVVPGENGSVVPGVDGLITAQRGVVLGIYVADCAAVGLVDRVAGAIGLVHAGRKGAEREIVPRAVRAMTEAFGTNPSDLEVAISPCIRPPQFEVDFAGLIHQQLKTAGVAVENITDAGLSTAENLTRFYSYRVERGKTGRMLALLGWSAQDWT